MLTLILFLLGIVAVIVNANTDIIIANWIIYSIFGISGISLFIQLAVFIFAKRLVKSQFDKFDF